MPITLNGSGAVTGLSQLPDSAMAAGSILQILSATKTDTQSISANATPSDIVGLSITITPASSSSKFYITGKVQYGVRYGTTHQLHINVNGTEVAGSLGDADGVRPRAHGGNGYISTGQTYANYSVAVDFLVNASDGNAHTIKLQGSNPDTNGSGILHINRTQTDGNGPANPRYVSTLTVMEVAG
jgi:hypothetical protein|tara:strand:+ start:21 stop:575 length:555 start_codon:yes stop_codon:yes gene_type:complete